MWWLTDARDAHVVDPLRRTMLMNYFRSRTSAVGARVTFINGCARERENESSLVSTRRRRRDGSNRTRQRLTAAR